MLINLFHAVSCFCNSDTRFFRIYLIFLLLLLFIFVDSTYVHNDLTTNVYFHATEGFIASAENICEVIKMQSIFFFLLSLFSNKGFNESIDISSCSMYLKTILCISHFFSLSLSVLFDFFLFNELTKGYKYV